MLRPEDLWKLRKPYSQDQSEAPDPDAEAKAILIHRGFNWHQVGSWLGRRRRVSCRSGRRRPPTPASSQAPVQPPPTALARPASAPGPACLPTSQSCNHECRGGKSKGSLDVASGRVTASCGVRNGSPAVDAASSVC